MLFTTPRLRFVLPAVFSLATVLCVYEGRTDEPPAIDQGNSSESGQLTSSFQQLQAEHGRLKEEAPSRARLIEEWLAAHDLTALNVDQVAWCLTQSLPNDSDREALNVTLTGVLTPPRSGSYVFSTTPINVNREGPRPVKHRIVATLGEKTLLDTLPDAQAPAPSEKEVPSAAAARSPEPLEKAEWTWRGQPNELQADQQVALRVVMEYRCSSPEEMDSPSAILFWEGPGLDRQVVGKSFLKDLQAEYQWISNGKTHTDRQSAATVDFAWTAAAHAAPPRPELVAKLTDRLWQLATDPAYLDACEASKAIHIYLQESPTTEYLNSARREEFLELLVSRPELLATADTEAARRLYQRLRFGAEEAALDMLGAWMQLHADIAPEIAFDFFQQNRRKYWELGDCMARQMPEHLNQLRDNYLRMDDGRCSLPLAYTLTYGYLTVDQLGQSVIEPRGQMPVSRYDAWVEFLRKNLDDESLAGDARVNWLLAQAQVREVRREPIEYSPVVRENLLAGKEWLDEARLIAESEQTTARLAQEQLARYADYRMWENAEQMVELLPPHEAGTWRSKLKQLQSEVNSAAAIEKQRSDASLLAEFERRRQMASDRGDDSASNQYSAKIEQLQTLLKDQAE